MEDIRSTIYNSKLNIPNILKDHVKRPRLYTMLEKGLNHKLTIIQSPSGFGKTSLLAEWILNSSHHTIWLSLFRGDDDIDYLIKHLLYGVLNLTHAKGIRKFDPVQLSTIIGMNNLSGILIREIERFKDNIIIVIDDYHPRFHAFMDEFITFILNHMPANLHIFLLSRELPKIPLSKLKVAGELNQIDTNDIKFTKKETGDYLNSVLKINISEKNICSVYRFTKGWISGMRMIVLSRKESDNISEFIDLYRENNRDFYNYIEEEVLFQQKDSIQEFLLKTSILSNLTPELCNAVTGKNNGSSILEELNNMNLFISLLDSNTKWYRYHNFFGDVIYTILKNNYPDQIPELHIRACNWYIENYMVEDALFHAFESDQIELAAEIIENEGITLLYNGEFQRLNGWLSKLPERKVTTRPQLSIYKATIGLIIDSSLEEVIKYAADMDKQLVRKLEVLKRNGNEHQISAEKNTLGQALVLKAISKGIDSIASSKPLLNEALQLLAGGKNVFIIIADILLTVCNLLQGDIEDMDIQIEQSLKNCRRVKNPFFEYHYIVELVFYELFRGKLKKAEKIITQELEKREDTLDWQSETSHPVSTLLIMKGEIYREQGRYAEAETFLKNGISRLAYTVPNHFIAFAYCSLAKVLFSKGDLTEALKTIENAEDFYLPIDNFLLGSFSENKARIHIYSGHPDLAKSFVKKMENSKFCDLDEEKYNSFLTYTTYLIQNGEDVKAFTLSKKIIDAAVSENRFRKLLDAYILAAMAAPNKKEALSFLNQALLLAGPEEYIQGFTDHGKKIADLFTELKKEYPGFHKSYPEEYISKLLDHLKICLPEDQNHVLPSNDHNKILETYHIDPLTKREVEVLECMAKGLTNKEVSEVLSISVGTVKWHVHKILAKLQVSNRTEAVSDARILGIIG